MIKYTCTMMGIGDIYYVTLIAENEQQAKEMAMAETQKGGYAGRPRNWSVGVRHFPSLLQGIPPVNHRKYL